MDTGHASYSSGTDIIATTNNDGKAVFKGLKEYTMSGETLSYISYWLVATQVPSGYNLLNAPVQATFNNTANEIDNNFTVRVNISSNTGFVLPVTGGTGTIIFTVVGIVLIGIAILLILFFKKKKDDSEEEKK